MFSLNCRKYALPQANRQQRQPMRPKLEVLEDRALPAVITPISYDMPNGQGHATGGGSTLNYWDEQYSGSGDTRRDGAFLSGGLGQLTDGIIGNTNYNLDLGRGPAYEWVGWLTIEPTITFHFADRTQFSSISIHINNFRLGGVGVFDQVVISMSDDGINFSEPQTYTTTAMERADTTARFITIPIQGEAQHVRAAFSQNRQLPWLFISEVEFNTTLPDLVADALTWNTAQGGVDFSYRVEGADLPQATTAGLYWSNSASFDPQQATLAAAAHAISPPRGTAGTMHVGAADLTPAPAGTTHLLLVVDPPSAAQPTGAIDEGANEGNNVLTLEVPDIAVLSGTISFENAVRFVYQTARVTGSIEFAVFASADNQYDLSDEKVASGFVTLPSPNGTATGVLQLPLFPANPARPYLLIVADPKTTSNPRGAVVETNENNNQVVLKPDSIDALVAYLQRTFPSAEIRVTSGLRRVREQATLMVEDAVKRLAQGHPDKFLKTYDNAQYAQDMVAYLNTTVFPGGPRRWEVIWTNRKLDQDPIRDAAIAKFVEIIELALKNGSFVSRHLTGDAIDISIPKTNQDLIRELLAVIGAQLNTTEHGNGPHWHITYLV